MKILEAEGTASLFEEIVTRDSRTPPYQDKQEMMRYLLQKWELEPGGCLMIGDTMEDAEAASKTGMRFCLVTHGYGAVPEGSAVPVAFRIDHFAEFVSSRTGEAH
jgi:phosphoglycolate phosphatase-like HAD superfamily hydrolase